ncbi:hypothetical protein D6D18_09979 [Aureobasidium pullulans]|nr:hypothetical protein D6D18_09979 [Aureobasidium pullulans]
MFNMIKTIVLGASLCAAMPYSVDFPSITLDIHPTFSHNTIIKPAMPTSSFPNQTTSYTLAIHPTFRAVTNNNATSSALGACGLGIGACPTDLCCRQESPSILYKIPQLTYPRDSEYGYCGSNSSYCNSNCQPDFGTCNLNITTTTPIYSFSYQPLSTSISATSNDNTGAAGIITDDVAPAPSTVGINHAPESTGDVHVPTITLPTVTGISFEPISTTHTAVQSTWAATSYEEASMITVTMKKIGCAADATSSQV